MNQIDTISDFSSKNQKYIYTMVSDRDLIKWVKHKSRVLGWNLEKV